MTEERVAISSSRPAADRMGVAARFFAQVKQLSNSTNCKLGVVEPNCSPSTWMVEAGGSGSQGHPELYGEFKASWSLRLS